MTYLLRKGLSHLLALLMVANPIVLQQLAALGQEKAKSARNEALPEPTPEDLKRMADDMERAFKALEAAEKEIPRDTFDPKAIVDKVGRDPMKLFEWVRDNTFWVPYRGSLRGPTGVLMDRLGSSLDRALLLAELLQTAGHQVRLARAELSEEQAKELLPKVRPVPDHPLPPTPPTSKEELNKLIEQYAKQYQLDAGALHKNIEKNAFDSAKLAEEVTQRVAEQVPALLKAVGKPSEKDAAAQRAREAADQLASMRDHWWVQRQDNNTWVDLDVLLRDGQPRKLVAAKEIISTDKKDGRFHLDSKYCHEVVIRIVIEQWKKEALTEKTVLSHTLRPSELFGQRIALNHYPMKWPKDLDLFKEKKPLEKLKSTVLAQDEWLPILTVGNDQFIESSFTDSGDTIDKPLAPLLGGGAQKLGGSIGGILGSGKIGEAAGRSPKKDSQLTAEWIKYELRVPGREAENIQRQIFDLVGPAVRSDKTIAEPRIAKSQCLERGLALAGQTEILGLVNRLSSEFLYHLTAKNLLDNRPILLGLLQANNTTPVQKLIEQGAQAKTLPFALYHLAFLRQELGRFREHVFLDRPNLVSFFTFARVNSQGQTVLRKSFDIVENELAVRHTMPDPFSVRLEQGVLETNAEAMLMGSDEDVENTGNLFARSRAKGIQWVVIRSEKDPAWAAMSLPKDIRARIKKDMAAGNLVLVPSKIIDSEKRLAFAWWTIDAKTGRVMGISETGQGGSATENALVRLFQVGAVIFAGITFIGCIGGTDATKVSNRKTTLCLFCALAAGALFFGCALGYHVPAMALAAGFFTGAGSFWTGSGLAAACTFVGLSN